MLALPVAEHRRQHYVPRFYLRRFSSLAQQINLINMNSYKPVIGAKLKTQAYENYFYGTDLSFEKGLADLEEGISKLITAIVERGFPPPQNSEDHIAILYYTILQNSRTLFTAEMINEMTNQMFVEIMSHDPQVSPEMLQQVKYGYENPAQFAIGVASDSLPMVTDLQMKVLRNYTNVDLYHLR